MRGITAQNVRARERKKKKKEDGSHYYEKDKRRRRGIMKRQKGGIKPERQMSYLLCAGEKRGGCWQNAHGNGGREGETK